MMLDPRVMSHDWNFTNNQERRAFDLTGLDWRFDTFVREASARDRVVLSVSPTVWYNDAAELTLGVRLRSNYLGRFNKVMLWLSRGTTGEEPATLGESLDFYARLENPVWLRRPRTKQSLEAWSLEGRTGGRLRWETEHRSSWTSPDWYTSAWIAQAMVTRNDRFLDPALWEIGGTAEVIRTHEWYRQSGTTRRFLSVSVGGGVAYASRADGLRLDRRYDTEPFGRATAALAVRRSFANGAWDLGFRFFAGTHLAENPPFRQRAIPLAGADPYQTMHNPLVRSRGAPFVRDEVFYHSPGNGNLRGYQPGAGGRWLGAVNVEVGRSVYRRRSGVLRSAAVMAFADGGIADTLAVPSPAGRVASVIADAGVGFRFGFHVGDVTFPVRLEFPLFVSRPKLAHNQRQGTDRFEFRWLIGLAPSF